MEIEGGGEVQNMAHTSKTPQENYRRGVSIFIPSKKEPCLSIN